MTYRAVILVNPGADVANIEVTFYAASDKEAQTWVERFMAQVGVGGSAIIAAIAD